MAVSTHARASSSAYAPEISISAAAERALVPSWVHREHPGDAASSDRGGVQAGGGRRQRSSSRSQIGIPASRARAQGIMGSTGADCEAG